MDYFGYEMAPQRDARWFHDDDIRNEWRLVREYLRDTFGRRNRFTNDQIVHAQAIVRARLDGADWRLARALEPAFANAAPPPPPASPEAPTTPAYTQESRTVRRRVVIDLTCDETM